MQHSVALQQEGSAAVPKKVNTVQLRKEDSFVHRRFNEQAAYLQLALVIFVLLAIVGLFKWSIDRYETIHGSTAPPWSCDSGMMTKAAGMMVASWYLLGMYSFTRLFLFTEERRHLTVIESGYLCMQIITTIGYGDLLPCDFDGQVFMVFYIVSGITLVAFTFSVFFAKINDITMDKVEKVTKRLSQRVEYAADMFSESSWSCSPSRWLNRWLKRASSMLQTIRGSLTPMLSALLQVVTSLVVGTCFFHYYPGSGKTVWEAFYMCIISMTTVGFGGLHPVSEGGKLFATFWGLLSVSSMANLVQVLCEFMSVHKKELLSDHINKSFLQSMDKNEDGQVDKLEFLMFELVRTRACGSKDIQRALDSFDRLDVDGSGTLSWSDSMNILN